MTREFLEDIFRVSNKILRPYPLCHSRPDRSLSYRGRYFGLCARCTGMYTSGILTMLTYPVWGASLTPALSILLGVVLLIPGGIDGVTQLIGDRESTNSIRVLTGVLLGVGVVLFANGGILFLLGVLFQQN
ncbi:DUF2085 domain-containing protein [Haloplanus salinarum]|uniref:DUF2085 domain-containing protein n=1 Tax=Haloplanus salinarum TaxID=1912324 RepID=UPI003CCD00E4